VDGLEVSTIGGLLLTWKSVFRINRLSKISSGQENNFLKILSKKSHVKIHQTLRFRKRFKKSKDRKTVIYVL
jgi:hypothetical protein